MRKNTNILEDEDLPEGWISHISQTIPYSVPEVLTDLLNFSARTLVLGGRLVYWIPTTNTYQPSDIPKHPCFNLISNCEQVINTKWSRRLITMEKITQFDPSIHIMPKIEYDPNLSFVNFSMKILNDPNRHDKRTENKKEEDV